jgi:hypothetical protein
VGSIPSPGTNRAQEFAKNENQGLQSRALDSLGGETRPQLVGAPGLGLSVQRQQQGEEAWTAKQQESRLQ